ncbi:chitin synthase-domain-containing protein [Phlyctochytrium arcticum]|nr:chitin synthase-domain-containing protein [Phlyctochytrium arcticum]
MQPASGSSRGRGRYASPPLPIPPSASSTLPLASSPSSPPTQSHLYADNYYNRAPSFDSGSEITPLTSLPRPSSDNRPDDTYNYSNQLDFDSTPVPLNLLSKRTTSMYDSQSSAAPGVGGGYLPERTPAGKGGKNGRPVYTQAAYPQPQALGPSSGGKDLSDSMNRYHSSSYQTANPSFGGSGSPPSPLLPAHQHHSPSPQLYDNTFYEREQLEQQRDDGDDMSSIPPPPQHQPTMMMPEPGDGGYGQGYGPAGDGGYGQGYGPGTPQYAYNTPYGYNFHYPHAYPPAQQYLRRRGPGTLFRHKTTKTVELTASGNFVVEIPVPEKVLSQGKFRHGREFTHLRYSAVCGDPNEFVDRGYTLRSAELGRQTELFIVMTMYNEDEILFAKTFKSVMKNIAYLCSKKRHAFWGPDGWQKVVVCVVADGRTKIHPRTLNMLGVMGAYQEGVIKTSISHEQVAAHVFELTTQVCVDTDLNVRGTNTGLVPVQVLFCLKEKNAKKINSHRWFFNAFGKVLRPNVCVLLDVGTKPTERSLYRLWKAFDTDPTVAGACGEICTEKGSYSHKLLNPLVAAQNFEYKMSNIMDKPLESVFGFIAVLPGAFSAYRFCALQNGSDGTGPLEKYFIGERMHGSHGDVKLGQANMYLAEDRILCFELVTKRNENWILRYVKDAKAETDVPDTIAEFISQRRRWLNGSFFAGVHAIAHFYQIFRSGHSPLRKFTICLQLLYNSINVVFNWFSLANFYLIFYFLSEGMVRNRDTDPFFGAGEVVFLVIRQIYIFAIAMIFIASLGNRPQGSRILYMACFALFAFIMALMLYMAGFSIYKTVDAAVKETQTTNPDGTVRTDPGKIPNLLERAAFRDLVLSTASTYGAYFIASFAYLDPWHMFSSFLQYLLLLPSFVNILMVYAFGNLHDVSWGTKGDNGPVDIAPVVVKKDDNGAKTATVDLPVNQHDIDAAYETFLRGLVPPPASKKKVSDGRSDKLKQEDYFRTFRTRVVLSWILCNAILIATLTTPAIAEKMGVYVGEASSDRGGGNSYLTFILWSVAVLSLVRFMGSMAYLCFQGSSGRHVDEREKWKTEKDGPVAVKHRGHGKAQDSAATIVQI